jgi:ankyrin repeat protein
LLLAPRRLPCLCAATPASLGAKDYHPLAPPTSTAGNHQAIPRILIARGAEVNARDRDGRAPLQVAAANGLQKMPQLLVASGADVNAADMGGRRPLYRAVQGGHRDPADFLSTHGARQEQRPLLVPKPACAGATL